MFHVKRRHKNPPLHDFGPCRGGFSARSFSIPAGSRKECLSGRGNADDIFKILIRFAFPALGLDAVLFHHIDGMVDGIHKDTHITDDDAAARRLTLEALREHPETNCVYVAGAGVGGVGQAVREAGLLGNVPILAFDDIPATRSLVRAGGVPATVCQQPYEQGYRAVKLMFQVLANQSVPPARWIARPVIKIRENIDEKDGEV